MKLRIAAAVVAITLPLLASPSAAIENLSTLFTPAVRGAQSEESVYFVMTDRFENGDTGNDNGGLIAGKFSSGFLPNDIGWWHGGDFRGITNRLDYIKEMGFTSIWITPPVKQIVFQGNSSAYHGYWGLDFMTVDPHLGSEADFKVLVQKAHEAGLKVIVDVVANHTADIIQYPGNSTSYVGINNFPYKTASGKSFDLTKVTGKSNFPLLSVKRSFPYIPIVASDNSKAKNPAWLNDLTNYHNRGNSSFTGESSLDGDFYGLDDLFTEKPNVVKGWTEVWSYWINQFDIDGLRIDTMKHVNPNFWKAVIPKVLSVAKQNGKKDFLIFGEVFNTDPYYLANFIRSKQTPSVLDFAFQKHVAAFARSGYSGESLASLFNADDVYTTPSANAYQLATFLGNHDMGRIGLQLRSAVSADQSEMLLERAKLSNALLFFLRGGPVLYYGDEVGMIGFGGDKEARQDMFPTLIPQWQSMERIGSMPIGSKSSFDIANPLRLQISKVQALIKDNPALRNGVQQVRFAQDGVFAVTRYAAGQEYIVAFNGSDQKKEANFATSTANSTWKLIDGSCEVTSSVTLSLPARTYCVLKASEKLMSSATPAITLRKVVSTLLAGDLLQLSATVPGDDYVEVSFLVRRLGGSWKLVGTSDHRTFKDVSTRGGLLRVFLDPQNFKSGSKVEVVAVAKGSNAQVSTSKISQLTIKY